MLRIEAVAHNTQQLNCGRGLDKFPEVVSGLTAVLERFADALSCIDQCFIADDLLEQLPAAKICRSSSGNPEFAKDALHGKRPPPGRGGEKFWTVGAPGSVMWRSCMHLHKTLTISASALKQRSHRARPSGTMASCE